MSQPSALTCVAPSSPARLPLVICALGFGVDQMQLQMGGALATIFLAPPYSLDPHRLSWLVGAVYIGGFIGAALLGRVADRGGLRKVLRWTLVWLAITSVLSCVRDDPTWVAVFRLLIGISLGAYPPLMVAYLTSIAPEGERGKWIFWVCGLGYIATPISLFALRFLTASHPAGVAGWRWMSVAIGALALITGYLVSSLPEPAKSPTTLSGASRPSAVAMLMTAPLRRTLAFVAVLYVLYPWGTAAFFLLTGPLLLQRGFTVNTALWYVAFATAWPAVGTLAAAWVVDRIPRRTAMLCCCATMLIAALCFLMGHTALSLSVSLVAFGIAQSLYPAVMTTLGAESFPATLRATATSLAWALNRIAALLVPVVLLPLLQSSGPVSVGVCVAAALILSAGITLGFCPAVTAVECGRSPALFPRASPSVGSVGR